MSVQVTGLLTPERAADYLQVNRETIYRYIRAGKLAASRLGRGYRISKSSLDQMLSDNRTQPKLRLRIYSDQQLADFLEADQLDSDAQLVVKDWRGRVMTPDA